MHCFLTNAVFVQNMMYVVYTLCLKSDARENPIVATFIEISMHLTWIKCETQFNRNTALL